MAEELKAIIEALIFAADSPLEVKKIAEITGINDINEIFSHIDALKQEYATRKSGLELVFVAGGFQFRTRPDLAHWVRKLRGSSNTLTPASLETLAIVAYRQPISRTQVSEIRGVNADGVMRLLVTRGYIEATHRDTGPGQAALYSTTTRFLERLGLYSIEELPPLNEFVPTIEDVEALEAALFGDDESL